MNLAQRTRQRLRNLVRILWLEDNPDDVELGLASLRKAGLRTSCQVVESRNAFAEKLGRRTFDIVLADFQLSSWTGLDALELLRQSDPETPFIMVTGTLPESTAIRCIEQGVSDYVLKEGMARLPVSVRLALVNKALRERSTRAERALREAEIKSRDQLRRLAAHTEQVREGERKRIAREVHDVLGQALTGLKMDLAWVVSRLNSADRKLLRRASAMSRLIDNMVQTVRKIATELRPGILDQLGLFAAIEWQVEQFKTQTGIRCSSSIDCPGRKLDSLCSIGFFRILQEILTNVIRHAKATEVKVAVRASKENLLLEVRDNGCGIDARRVVNPKSLGILGMRERAHVLGGELAIEGERGRGTRVLVKIPG